MIKTATQLKAKIRNISGGDSRIAMTMLRVFFMERFLERVLKSYYGILLLGKDQNPDHSRESRIFVFSNDGNGKIMRRNEYDSLFKQIKNTVFNRVARCE